MFLISISRLALRVASVLEMVTYLDATCAREDAQIAETELFLDQLQAVAVWVAD